MKVQKSGKSFKISFLVTVLAVVLDSFLFFSCVSSAQHEKIQGCSRELLGKGIKSESELAEFFISENPEIPLSRVKSLAKDYVTEAQTEGINSDVAFVQMCLETGFLKFGNLVKPEWHNYCGLGAMNAENPGEKFKDQKTGVRAHIQHLQAYATTQDVKLKQPLVDPRYSWVHKAKFAETVFDLAGTWATDPDYGKKLDTLLSKLENF